MTHAFRLKNPIAFQKHLRLELTGTTEAVNALAVAYWYQNTASGERAELDAADLLLPTFRLADVVEAESLATEGVAKIAKDTDLAGEASGGTLLKMSDAGANLLIDVPQEGDYNVGLGFLYLADSAITLDFALGEEPFDPLSQLTQVSLGDLPIGGNWVPFQIMHLKAGKQKFRLKPEKGKTAYLDFVRLIRQERHKR